MSKISITFKAETAAQAAQINALVDIYVNGPDATIDLDALELPLRFLMIGYLAYVEARLINVDSDTDDDGLRQKAGAMLQSYLGWADHMKELLAEADEEVA